MTDYARARFNHVILPRLDEAYRLARWLTGDPTDAEDVVQEACLRAFSAIEGFEEGNARAWFLTIVRNTCYTWLRRHRPRAVVSSEALDPAEQVLLDTGGVGAETLQTPESALIGKQDVERLGRMIEALPVQLKEALVLREYHELTYREIAEITCVPMGTVMSRLARARQHLLSRFEANSR